MGASVWDKEGAVEELKKLQLDGYSCSRIADALAVKHNVKVSRSAVIGKLHRLGRRALVRPGAVKKRKKPVERRAALQPRKISPLRRALEMAPEPMTFAVVEEVVVPDKERVGVEGLGPHQCKWPIGDPGKPDFHFCHHKRIGGISYCEIHARRAYETPEQRRRNIAASKAPAREVEKV